MTIIWPNQNNPEPPDQPEHYPECNQNNDRRASTYGDICICDEVLQWRADDAVERELQDRKERDL